VVDQVGVAVGIELVTELGCVSECIAVQRDAVGLVRLPVVVVVGVRAVGVAVLIKVGKFIDKVSVAITIDGVALLCRSRMDGRISGAAVLRVGVSVSVVIAVVAVGAAVPIEVSALAADRASSGRARPDLRIRVVTVFWTLYPIAIGIKIDAVGLLIAVRIGEAVDQIAIAVVIDIVAGLDCTRMKGGVGVVAVTEGRVEAVSVHIADYLAETGGMQVERDDPSGNPLADQLEVALQDAARSEVFATVLGLVEHLTSCGQGGEVELAVIPVTRQGRTRPSGHFLRVRCSAGARREWGPGWLGLRLGSGVFTSVCGIFGLSCRVGLIAWVGVGWCGESL
jgi:hypothetical protein